MKMKKRKTELELEPIEAEGSAQKSETKDPPTDGTGESSGSSADSNSLGSNNHKDTKEFPPPPYPDSVTDTDVVVVKVDGDPDGSSVSSKSSVDPWDIVETEDTGPKWKDISLPWKIVRIIWVILRILMIVGLLYFFICSLDVLQDAFQLLAGRAASSVFANSVLINNPVSALMIGVLVTVLVQSSSTSTSIVVSMVGSQLLTVQQAIPIIMGANIGTTVTNTLVALTQSPDRDVFRRAFAGATVHDAFNWLTVFVLLPLECASHYLYHLTEAMTQNIAPPSDLDNPQFLTALTDPLTSLIIQLDKKVLEAIAQQTDRQKFPMAKYYCTEVLMDHNQTYTNLTEGQMRYEEVDSMMFTYNVEYTEFNGTDTSLLTYTEVLDANSTRCSYLFHGTGMPGALSEPAAGGILLISALLVMTISLLIMVKVLNSLLEGPMARIVRKVVNADFPGCFSYFTGYVAMLFGVGITIIFQSSSVFTSTLTPLVGIGVITVERVYPLTLGSNIGTTVTSILAALAGDPSVIKETMQISFCHLFFNISGILLYYPIPFMRIPIPIAKRLGMTTANYRWFAVVYLIVMFLLFPLIIFGLSMAGWYVLLAVGVPFILLVVFIIVVNVLQRRKPNWLPKKLRTWQWLPKPLRSFQPYDKVITICCKSKKCCCNKGKDGSDHSGSELGSSSDIESQADKAMVGTTELETRSGDKSGEGKAGGHDNAAYVKTSGDGSVHSDASSSHDNPAYEEIGDEAVYSL